MGRELAGPTSPVPLCGKCQQRHPHPSPCMPTIFVLPCVPGQGSHGSLEGIQCHANGEVVWSQEHKGAMAVLTRAVAKAVRLGVGRGAGCADVVESLHAILKHAYNAPPPPGGGEVCLAQQNWNRRGTVVLQLWEWWLLRFSSSTLRVRPHAPRAN